MSVWQHESVQSQESPSLKCYSRSGRNRTAFRVFSNSSDASISVAGEIADLIRTRAKEGKKCVLGLATGSSPVNVYSELVRLHQEGELSLANVVTFNLDEYFPMEPDALQSYVRFMNEHFFDHVDIPRENIHIPDGTVAFEQIAEYCRMYEESIEEAGGLDIQLLGIGRTGHIGFNEPGSEHNSRTRLITLDSVTRTDAASDFFGVENVPRRAITMGVGTILNSRRVLLLAFGEGKSKIIERTIEGDVSSMVPATFLQEHDNAEFFLDESAAAQLTDVRWPWLVEQVVWTDGLVRRAVISLADKVGKPILMLTDADYNEHGLQDLLAEYGSAYEINLKVFRHLQSTITGWPAGKPDHAKLPGDRSKANDHIFPKRIVCFSPHPDDDVISMGGTLLRLADQGHDVHVAYQTSGNIAVFDEAAMRFAQFVAGFCDEFNIESEQIRELANSIATSLNSKQSGQVDTNEAQRIKGLIRRVEATAGANCCGVPSQNLHFLNLPFYETGRVRKKPISESDVCIAVELLREIKPQQIYAAGDLSDPHGTHRTCLNVVFEACRKCIDDDWMSTCEVWLYRGRGRNGHRKKSKWQFH